MRNAQPGPNAYAVARLVLDAQPVTMMDLVETLARWESSPVMAGM
jgi:hypothetical protein